MIRHFPHGLVDYGGIMQVNDPLERRMSVGRDIPLTLEEVIRIVYAIKKRRRATTEKGIYMVGFRPGGYEMFMFLSARSNKNKIHPYVRRNQGRRSRSSNRSSDNEGEQKETTHIGMGGGELGGVQNRRKNWEKETQEVRWQLGRMGRK